MPSDLELDCCPINNIPDSLLIEILLRLPLKSAKHCTLVCKRWYALMSNSYFGRRFLERNNSTFAMILFSYETRHRINRLQLATSPKESFFRSRCAFSLPYLRCRKSEFHNLEPAIAVAYCKDLILCCSKLRSQYVYYICNPVTKKWIKLPPSPPPPHHSFRIGFICEGQGSNFRYAVVRIPYSDVHLFSSEFKVQTFSSDTGSWAEIMVPCAPQIFGWVKSNNRRGVPYNGLLFWTTFLGGLIGLDPYNRDVVSICVWDLKNYEMGEWCLKHDIKFSCLRSNGGFSAWFQLKDDDDHPTKIMDALACDPNDADIVYICIDYYKVVSCNMRTRTLDEMYCNDTITKLKYVGDAFTYELPWLPTPIPPPPPPGYLLHRHKP